MAISDSQKLDFLWKKLGYGFSKTETNSNKLAVNESISSPLLLRGDIIWTQSGSIPTVQPGSSSSLVTVYPTSTPLECTNDGSASPNRTWLTGVTDWISPEFGATFIIKVYIHTSGDAANAASSGTQVLASGSGNNDEWFFDYQSGVLNFNGTNLPNGVNFSGKSVYIAGARYNGNIGFNNVEFNSLNVSGVSTFSGLVDINDGGQANTFKVEDLTDNRVVIAGTGGELEDDANLTFNGSTLAVGVNLDVTGDLDVDGHTNLDNVSVAGVTTFNNNVNLGAMSATGRISISRGFTSDTDYHLYIRQTTNAEGATIKFADDTSATQFGYFTYKHSDSLSNSAANSFHFNSSETSTAVIIDQTTSPSGFYVGTNRCLTTADEGSGNGIDADTVDGIQGANFLRSDTSDEMAGNLTIDNGQNSTITVKCDDNGQAGIRLYGDSQGTGFVEVGQSSTYGGGMSYNGDGSPAFASGETTDRITFYRMDNGNRSEVFAYPYNSDTVTFNGTVSANSFSGNGSNLTSVDASSLGGEAKTTFMYRIANSDLQMNGQSFLLGTHSGSVYSKIRWSGTTNLWDLISGNLLIRDNTTTRFTFARTTGNFTATGDVTAFSDITLKKNIELIPNALDKVLNLRGVTYNRIDIENEPKQSGVIAQEVEKVLPEVVHTNGDGIKSVSYGNMVGLLIEAIKEQQQQIDELKRKLEEK